MQKTVEFMENRIKWKASQYDIPNKYVLFFENLSSETKNKYVAHFNEEDSGKIILLFKDSNNYWTALGTKMIIGYDGIKFNSVNLDSIKDVDSKIRKEYFSIADSETVKPKTFNKRSERELLITDLEGRETVFITRKGSDLFSLWNIMIMITRLNKNSGYSTVNH